MNNNGNTVQLNKKKITFMLQLSALKLSVPKYGIFMTNKKSNSMVKHGNQVFTMITMVLLVNLNPKIRFYHGTFL